MLALSFMLAGLLLSFELLKPPSRNLVAKKSNIIDLTKVALKILETGSGRGQGHILMDKSFVLKYIEDLHNE